MSTSGRAAIPVVVAAFCAVAGAAPALAAQPSIERVPIQEEFVDDFLSEQCGVDVTTELSGFVILREFDDGSGRLVQVTTVNIAGTASAEAGSFRFRNVGADVTRVAPDGTVTVTIIGQLPFDFAGSLVFNADTEELVREPQFVRGTNQLERACEVLNG